MQTALIRTAPTFERKAARMASLLRSAQFIGRYTSDLAGREARQQELTKHWCGARLIASCKRLHCHMASIVYWR